MHVRETLFVSERRACRVLGQMRRTQRYTPKVADDDKALTDNIVSLATEYGRYGYRRITALLKIDRWLAGEPQAGGEDLASGGAEGAGGSRRESGCGSTTGSVSGFDRSITTTSGLMTSYSTGRVKVQTWPRDALYRTRQPLGKCLHREL